MDTAKDNKTLQALGRIQKYFELTSAYQESTNSVSTPKDSPCHVPAAPVCSPVNLSDATRCTNEDLKKELLQAFFDNFPEAVEHSPQQNIPKVYVQHCCDLTESNVNILQSLTNKGSIQTSRCASPYSDSSMLANRASVTSDISSTGYMSTGEEDGVFENGSVRNRFGVKDTDGSLEDLTPKRPSSVKCHPRWQNDEDRKRASSLSVNVGNHSGISGNKKVEFGLSV